MKALIKTVVLTVVLALSLGLQVAPVRAAEDETGNNLSVPAVFVPSVGVGSPTCTGGDDTVSAAGYQEEFGGTLYYIQGEATWQADCETASDATVRLEWGDNLTNAPLKAGTPIRVEVGLLAAGDYSMTGFTVIKLTNEPDRLATYGTIGTEIDPYPEVRVWNQGATLRIERSDGAVVYSGSYTAEINATGRVVYGYNWKKPTLGTYTITFHAPTVTITGKDAGTIVDDHTVELTVTVKAKGGGRR